MENKIPNCNTYLKYLNIISIRLNLNMDVCRDRFGLYTENQWQELFNN